MRPQAEATPRPDPLKLRKIPGLIQNLKKRITVKMLGTVQQIRCKQSKKPSHLLFSQIKLGLKSESGFF